MYKQLAYMALGTLLYFTAAASAVAGDYLLGPQDALKIRVFEWRPSAGVAFEWTPLTGEFVVSASGSLSLPIIGSMPVTGKSLDQVAEMIGEQLQQQIGLQKRPNASVEVSTYRPFFVTGMVATPGKYAFSPGLTVTQALSMAGGTGAMDPRVMELQRDAMIGEGALRELEAERASLLARQARVDAVLRGDVKIVYPAQLTARSSLSTIAQMMSDEQALLDSRLRSMNTEIASLGQSKILATNQLEALKQKEISLTKQIEMATKDLSSINKLVSQGLTVSSRQLGANQNVAELESRSLDVSLAIVKTQQDLAKLDQDAVDVKERYRSAALIEASELRDRLNANDEKTTTARAVLSNIETRAPGAIPSFDPDGRAITVNRVSRIIDGVTETFAIGDNDPVFPGDVIRVERRVGSVTGSIRPPTRE
jgi:polysaccharide export outer membrane protein